MDDPDPTVVHARQELLLRDILTDEDIAGQEQYDKSLQQALEDCLLPGDFDYGLNVESEEELEKHTRRQTFDTSSDGKGGRKSDVEMLSLAREAISQNFEEGVKLKEFW